VFPYLTSAGDSGRSRLLKRRIIDMADQNEQKRGKVPIREFLADFRSYMTDRDLREKYGLSARNFVNLMKALVESKIISQQDLSRRRQMSVQRDLAKESEFLSQLFICPNCSHPSPHPFEICPACGAKSADIASPQRAPHLVTPTGGHFVVEESPQTETQETQVLDEDEVIEELPEEKAEDPKARKPRKNADAQEKQSSLGSLRSLFSKLKKS
jgi:hypothetical protein